MEELIAKLQEKAQACGYKTKEDRARKGAYVDCIMELKEALRIHAVSGSLLPLDVHKKARELSAGEFIDWWFAKSNDR